MSSVPRLAVKPIIKTEHDIAMMRVACRLASEVLDHVTPFVKPGVTTEELDRICHTYMVDVQGTIPAPLNYAPPGYRPYPKSVCTSVNRQVCHGIPGDKVLRNGDILNIDITLILDGWYGDSSRMYFVGEVPRRAARLCDVTHDCLMRGVQAVGPGRTTNAIGAAIQSHAERERCSVVRDFCGHGVGRVFHDAPTILHYVESSYDVPLRPGMIFTIEPMINLGRPQVKVLSDGWTAVTRDRSLSAQFEHTVGVTENGVEVFTYSPKGHHRPPYDIAA